MSAQDHVAAWLAQVHTDPDLPAYAFKVAFAVSQVADVAGVICATAVKTIANSGETGELITDLIGRLVDRGHLHPHVGGRKVDGFRLVVHGRATKPPQRAKTAA